MISSTRRALLHILKRHDILAVVTDGRIHDGGCYDKNGEGEYKKRIEPHGRHVTLYCPANQESIRMFSLLSW